MNSAPDSGKSNFFLILTLGALTALSPFSIDMYLPAFPQIAEDLGTTTAKVSLSLSSYFIGLSLGQLVYGPLLDRFGRKPPLYVGLIIYILASLGCMSVQSNESLILLRVAQALGGCAASVATMSMIRDLFSVREGAKVFSLLILVLGVSPLLAPTVGGLVTKVYGWHSVFMILAAIGTLLLLTVKFYLPESHKADPTVSLRPGPIFKNFIEILKEPQFYTYVFTGAVAFSGLFVYLAGSPIIFMEVFQVSGQVYSWIFAGISVGFIGMSQVNVILLRKHKNSDILRRALIVQTMIGLSLAGGTYLGLYGLPIVVGHLFLFLACFGLINPNAASMALAPFAKNAGSAAALMGFLQMGVGAAASMGVGVLGIQQIWPIALILFGTTFAAFMILIFGGRHIHHPTGEDSEGSQSIVH